LDYRHFAFQVIKMKKIALVLPALISVMLFPAGVFSQTEDHHGNVPNSAYLDNEDETKGESGGLLDMLPFFGNKKKEVPAENLAPAPARQNKPALPEEDINELRMMVGNWLVSSEITEPAVRKADDGKYYRDYIVFNDEYRIDVLRGDSSEKPFMAHIFVEGDHFQTAMHDTSEEAKLDRNFSYKHLDFRVIFERVEKWDYSVSTEEAPIIFREQWVFKKLQSKVKAEAPSMAAPQKADTSQTPPAAPEPDTSASAAPADAKVEEQQKPQQ
jgi:hypothetical protein